MPVDPTTELRELRGLVTTYLEGSAAAARVAAFRELRGLVATYLEGSDDAARAAELLAAIETPAPAPTAPIPTDRARRMFGCTTDAIDEALAGKSPHEIARYAMGTLSNAQELIQRKQIETGDSHEEWWTVADRDANTIRQFMNIAKYAIYKAVP